MENNKLSSLMRSTMEKVHEMVDTNTIVGEPISTADGVTLKEDDRPARKEKKNDKEQDN